MQAPGAHHWSIPLPCNYNIAVKVHHQLLQSSHKNDQLRRRHLEAFYAHSPLFTLYCSSSRGRWHTARKYKRGRWLVPVEIHVSPGLQSPLCPIDEPQQERQNETLQSLKAMSDVYDANCAILLLIFSFIKRRHHRCIRQFRTWRVPCCTGFVEFGLNFDSNPNQQSI